MDSDSVAGDVDSLHGGLSLLAPLLEQLLVDAVTQQQGWLQVYGKAGLARGTRVLSGARWDHGGSHPLPGPSLMLAPVTLVTQRTFLSFTKFVRGNSAGWVGLG